MRKLTSFLPSLVLLALFGAVFLGVPALMDRYSVAQQHARITLARGVLADDDILRRIDRSISAIADSIEPTVVHIETDRESRTGPYSSGAGWIYDTLGHVVTNAHVVRSSEEVSVEFFDGRIARGRVVGTDVYTDIAVVRVDESRTPFSATRAAERLPRVGERIFAFGSPFGFKFSMSEGIVSGLGRQAAGTGILGGYTNYIQTDAAVNPGNSGGPLVNSDGEVIGMNVAIATAANSVGSSPEASGADSAGISFAIPLGTIEPIVSQIIEHGSVSRGYLGIRFDPSRAGRVTLDKPGEGSVTGVRVTNVQPGGPSDLGGLVAEDIIVEVGGSPVLNAESLSSLISSHRAGETVDLEVYRDGAFVQLGVELGRMEDEVLAQRLSQPIQIQMGAVMRDHPEGVEVLQTWEGLPAAVSGIRSGDLIVSINGEGFVDRDAFFVRLADEGLLTGQRVELELIRDTGERETVTVQLM